MDVKSEILYRYPFPIAVTYLNANNVREPVGAHSQRLKVFEVIIKYLASIAIAQYLYDQFEDPRVRHVLRGLARPSLGQWNGFLREILSAYSRAQRTPDMFVSDLYDGYNKKRGDRPAMALAYNEMTNYVQTRTDSATVSLSVRQFCDTMVQYRNRTVGHGAITHYQCERMNEPLFDALEEMLGQLGFLREHRLVYIEDVRVRRGSYAHELMSFMGSTPPARMQEAYVTDRQEEYRVEEQLYLCARGENVPVLSLHPLVISWQGDVLFLNESERERGIEYLSYQSGLIKKPDRLLEDFKEVLGFVLGEEQTDVTFEHIRQQVLASPDEASDPYEIGRLALEEQRWAAAADVLGQVDEGNEHYAEAQAGLAVARRQQDLQDRYREGQRLVAARQWDQAQAVLEGVLGDTGGYRDVQELLQTIRMERAEEAGLQQLYEQALYALETSQWERAYDLLVRIRELRSDFRDVDTLLARQERLHDLYDQAIDAISGRRWAEAQTSLRQLEALEPQYKDVQSLLQRAERALDVETALSSSYSKARSHIALEEWEQALELLDQIADKDATYRDVVSLIAQVRAEIRIPCPQCGVMVASGYKFCGQCGAPIRSWVCLRCHSPVPESHGFCGKCGAPRVAITVAVCPSCGQENPGGRRFCSRCGHTLP